MVSEIKLVISQNNKTIETVIEKVNANNFVKTIENFQVVANATLTKMIEELGGSGDGITETNGDESELDEDESEPDEEVCTRPKRKKSNNA